MIKFFRNIRRRLLGRGKLRQYLAYALGEILLVVIGILIALQINNWNEAQKADQKQENYLLLVRQEMASNLDALHSEQQRLEKTLEGLREFVALCDQPAAEVSEARLSAAWKQAFSKTINLKYENGALTELISSGVLKEIKQDSISTMLASWEGAIQTVSLQETEVNTYLQKGNNYIEKHGIIRVVLDDTGGNDWWGIDKLPEPRSNKFLLSSPQFENILVFAIGTGRVLQDAFYTRLEKDMESLIRLIDREVG